LTDINERRYPSSTFIDEGMLVSSLPAQCCAPITADSLDDRQAEATASLFKALADPHRVKILNLLANSRDPVCVCDITDSMELSQPTVSFHLKKLVSAGLLNREERGTWSYYSIDGDALKDLDRIFQTKERTRTR